MPTLLLLLLITKIFIFARKCCHLVANSVAPAINAISSQCDSTCSQLQLKSRGNEGFGVCSAGLRGSLSIVINQKGSKTNAESAKFANSLKEIRSRVASQHFISHFDFNPTPSSTPTSTPTPAVELTRANNQHSRISLRGSPSYS